MIRRLTILAVVALLASGLMACGGSDEPEGGAPAFQPASPGVLRVATVLPSRPLVMAARPEDIGRTPAGEVGPGYEVELANELARRLGGLQVRWVAVPEAGVLGRPACGCDLGLAGVAVTEAREERVDLSEPYLTVVEALVVRSGTEVADLEAVEDLALGAIHGTAAMTLLEDDLDLERAPLPFADRDSLETALEGSAIDGGVTDLPTALDIVGGSGGRLQLSGQIESGERYAAVLPDDSPNTAAVSAAIRGLRREGFFDLLRAKYFPDQVRARTITDRR